MAPMVFSAAGCSRMNEKSGEGDVEAGHGTPWEGEAIPTDFSKRALVVIPTISRRNRYF